MTDPRTSYERAIDGFDVEHEHELCAAIMAAIIATSRVSDCDALVIRTGEAASALTSCLALVLALSPAVVRSPTTIRKTADELGKKLRIRVAAARANSEIRDFCDRSFGPNDAERGGNA